METSTSTTSAVELQVGKRYRLRHWDQGKYLDVLFVGSQRFFAVTSEGFEASHAISGPWVEVLPPIEVVRAGNIERPRYFNGQTFVTREGRWAQFLVLADRADEAIKRIEAKP